MNEHLDYYVHSTAVVDEGASIGRGSKIWHFCHIMSGGKIGEECILGQNVFIASKVTIGDHCKIQNNVSLYEGVILEEEVFIGPSAVFTNVLNPRAMVERKDQFRPTLVRRGASIGANATIVCGNELGCYCLVAAGAVVTASVGAYTVVGGNPARLMGYVSAAGETLHFDNERGEAICPRSGKKYKLEGGIVYPMAATQSH